MLADTSRTLLDTLARCGVARVADGDPRPAFALATSQDGVTVGAYPGDEFEQRLDPMVSCLMVTSGERFSISLALECYRRQLHKRREIVIVTYLDRVAGLRKLVDANGVGNASVHGVGRDLTLGEMRNVAVGRSRGDILIQWDDDDLYDPARISAAVALLTRSNAAATLLWRLLIWCPERELAAISVGRPWEGSMAVWRAHAPVHPSLNRMEDSHAVEFLASTRALALCSVPYLYVYVAHGRNTCDAQHFETHLAHAARVMRGKPYRKLIEGLALRMPILEYRAGLGL